MTAGDHQPRRTAVWGWLLFDLANTIFSFNILSFYFPVYLKSQLGALDSHLSIAFGASMALVAVASPLFGALTDRAPRRIPYLVATTVACCAATAVLGLPGLWTALLLFAGANVAFQLGLVVYDALLPTVSTGENVGTVGGAGISLGYVGSFIGLGTGALLLARLDAPHPWIFATTAGLFLLFAVPCFLLVRERPKPRPSRRPLSSVLADLRRTARDVARLPGLGRFLLARFTYTDAANTLILFMGIYATQEVGFPERVAQYLLGAGIAAAVVGGVLFGRAVDARGPKPVLQAVMGLWALTLALAAAVPALALPRGLFWAVAMLAGLSLGGTWAADRPLMLALTPAHRVGEFYGLYGMVGRFAAVVGPLVWALVVDGLALGRPVAVLTLLAGIGVAAWLLRGVEVGEPVA